MKNYIYLIIIIILSCTDSNFLPDKDCSGIIGGEAIIDDCGYCTGGNTKISFNQMLGCDNACEGSVYDIDNNCCPIYLWDCNGLCNGPDTLDCAGVCNGEAYLFVSDTWFDQNEDEEFDEEEDYYYDNNGIKIIDNDFIDSLENIGIENPCCYIDNCGVCDRDSTNNCVQDCADIWGGQAEIDDCGVCAGGNTEIVFSGSLINDNGETTYTGDNIDCHGVCNPSTIQGEIHSASGLNYGAFLDNCGVCDFFEDVDINSTCTYDCSLNKNDCDSPGEWQLNISDEEIGDSLCWKGPKADSIDSNGECCYRFNLFDQENDKRQDCNKICGGNSRVDYCGECDDDLSNDNDITGVPPTCVEAWGATSKEECANDSLVGRWNDEENKCYCRLKSEEYPASENSNASNSLSNCGLCVENGQGHANAGCSD